MLYCHDGLILDKQYKVLHVPRTGNFNMKVTIVTIGDEILIGQIVDTNSAWMATQLNLVGVTIQEIISVSDSREGIISGLDMASQQADIVLMTGGLGPTKDDITKKVLAEYFGDEMVFDEALWLRIKGMFEKRGYQTTDLHKLQCYMPESVEKLENNLGTAPGMKFKHKGVTYISMPGVPYEMKYIMETHVLPQVKAVTETFVYHKTIMTVGKGESMLSESIRDIEERLPEDMKLAYLPSLGKVRIRLSTSEKATSGTQARIEETAAKIAERVSEYVYGYDDIPLEKAIGDLCISHYKMIATGESCTGGLIAHRIVSIPGSSAYFKGGIVAYSNDMKQHLLDVPESTITQYGAVSEETVIAMAKGVLKKTGVDIVVTVSGIAGPTGGTAEKPVGTIWLACGDRNHINTQLLQLSKDRMLNIEYTTNMALNMIRRHILDTHKASENIPSVEA